MHTVRHQKATGQDDGILSDVMFAMRSVPSPMNGDGDDILAGVMFTMRSEPVDQHCPDSGTRA